MSRELLKQALHHLVDLADDLRRIPSDIAQTIAALEVELAKPEQEPVAWMTNSEHEYSLEYKFNWLQTPLHDIPLYTALPRKEWVGLTDKEIEGILDCGRGNLVDIKKAEQTLKDKNT